jgi:hypothetical protein
VTCLLSHACAMRCSSRYPHSSVISRSAANLYNLGGHSGCDY